MDFFLSYKNWFFLRDPYPLNTDIAFILPFFFPLSIQFIKTPREVIEFLLKGYGYYVSIVLILGIINFLPVFNEGYFSFPEFFKRILKLLILYPVIKSIFYVFEKGIKIAEYSISVYIYLLWGVVFLSELLSFFYLELEYLKVIEEDGFLRFSGILKEPSGISYIAVPFILILIFLFKSPIRFSIILSLLFVSFVCKSLFFIVVLGLTIAVLWFKRGKIYFDGKGILATTLPFIFSIILDIPNKYSKFNYFYDRTLRVTKGKDGSFHQRYTGGVNLIKAYHEKELIENIFLGKGLSQSRIYMDIKDIYYKFYIGGKIKVKSVGNLLLVLIIELGLMLVLLLMITFLDFKEKFKIFSFLCLSILSSGYSSFPIAVGLVLCSHNRNMIVFNKLFADIRQR